MPLFQNCQWSVIQRALGASCVRVRDGQHSETGRRIAADERISGESHEFECFRFANCIAAGTVLSFPTWMGEVKTQAPSTTDQEKLTKVSAVVLRFLHNGACDEFMLALQAGDLASVPRLQAMLLLATDALCVFNKPSGVSVQVRPALVWLHSAVRSTLRLCCNTVAGRYLHTCSH